MKPHTASAFAWIGSLVILGAVTAVGLYLGHLEVIAVWLFVPFLDIEDGCHCEDCTPAGDASTTRAAAAE